MAQERELFGRLIEIDTLETIENFNIFDRLQIEISRNRFSREHITWQRGFDFIFWNEKDILKLGAEFAYTWPQL